MEHAPTPDQPTLNFSSDNTAGAAPAVLDALVACAAGHAAPYGADPWTARVEQRLAELFEHEVAVFIVSTGTAANSLALAALTPPWGSVLCHPGSHINNDECGAPAFYADGAKLITVDGPAAKLDPARLRAAARAKLGDVHTTQPSAVSITQATEVGSVYTLDEIGTIGEICREANLPLHMDGARFANALVSLGCSPAEMTWRAGVDVLSFGATKNGVPGSEAVVLFDPRRAGELAFRRKRAGQLASKMRFLSAPLDAYLADDLWLRNARHANAMAQRLAAGLARVPGVSMTGATEANILFCRLPQPVIAGLLAAGVRFYHDRWEPGVVRFVTSFATTEAEVDRLLDIARIAAHH
ncbi:threonine aldolase family protein [Burkholderia gladioli]|uniref:L-threonine aldolase n=1 Tax=Burkholderia gladioli TaxID=28095 RepID=A0A2A7SGN7_BURGA|nr:low specificity L-threonine aldolase [Burkholderia gladioli]ATF88047.1 low specificity L-threonine aldolase [Burkholderia gladioli pv. gladioli]MBJ9665688.1 low specificity L-threonine aldolase [Burkholderia gladioli]MBJ9716193.1 low specificity L-threonine aldolase [Burkholderia gladioli]MBU9159160.1 low specificity L-threonine aldolase [Burkholderia gladioli]MBU9421602.1 low specificity L-threonine aldolase [Burkholderia gladioli]